MNTNIGLTSKNIQQLLTELSKLLADEFMLCTKTKHAHLNEEGNDFYSKHAFYFLPAFNFFYILIVDMPPSTCIICPVIQVDLLLNRKQAKLAISSGVPIFFSGCLCALAATFTSEFRRVAASGVFVMEGAMQFTLIFGANSAANAFVSPSMAPLEDATKE